MNESFKAQLVLITNNVRPTLDEIWENFFSANERYLCAQSKFKERKKNNSFHSASNSSERKSTVMAVSAEREYGVNINPFTVCSLCHKDTDSDHPINKCPNYISPKDKIDKLKMINACCKCGSAGHSTMLCRFSFKNPCRNCLGWHFSFLCLKPVVRPSDSPSKKSKSRTFAINVSVTASTFKSSNRGVSVLSTFTCEVNSASLRGLHDPGSQCNLVKEDALVGHSYEILEDNVDLTLNCVNDPKTYASKLVLIKLKLGNEYYYVDAWVVSKIPVSLKLPGLGRVVDAFVEKGYSMADRDLLSRSDSIHDLDLLLGADAAYCFKYQVVPFGVDMMSVYLSGDMGVMLLGKINRMIADVKSLPVNKLTVTSGSGDYVDNEKCCLVNFSHVASPISPVVNSNNDDFLYNESIESKIFDKAIESVLEDQCDLYLCKDDLIIDHENSDQNDELVSYLLNNVQRKDDGRIIMPLLWNTKVSHLLSDNYNLARNVLLSNKRKLSKDAQSLSLINNSLAELLDIGAIEKIDNLPKYIEEFPQHSFLAHMPIIKLGRESTKCRVVFLSNLCDKRVKNSISHNQAMLSGPCLNQKLSVALVHLRFGYHLLCFDLKKAFLQVELSDVDQSKLLFLWFKDPLGGDFSIEAYKNVRLSFGLRCSPTILMVTLYKILIVDADNDPIELKDLKRQIYSLIYMDNGAITYDDPNQLIWAYNQLNSIFNPYQFELQQFCTNNKQLNEVLPESDKNSDVNTELFGLIWDRKNDCLHTKVKSLNIKANTKRLILKSIAENFDPYNFDGPIMNRARLFLHDLQLRKDLGWDTKLPADDSRNWTNIVKQVESAKPMTVPRFVGKRGDSYDLLAFCDSSKVLYGTVIYIQNRSTKEVSFILAKNRMVSKQLDGKSIPSLELMSATLGADCLIDLKHELSGPLCVNPINIVNLYVYSDSLVALSWINSYFLKLSKMNKQTVFVMNRLKSLQKLTDTYPITFSFVDGFDNPSDYITRPLSYKMLIKTNYLTGPKFLKDKQLEMSRADILTFTIPASHLTANANVYVSTVHSITDTVVDSSRFSDMRRLIAVYSKVLLFINKLKSQA